MNNFHQLRLFKPAAVRPAAVLICLLALSSLLAVASPAVAASCKGLLVQGDALRYERTNAQGAVVDAGTLTITGVAPGGFVTVRRVAEDAAGAGTAVTMLGLQENERLTLNDPATGEQWLGTCQGGGATGRIGRDAFIILAQRALPEPSTPDPPMPEPVDEEQPVDPSQPEIAVQPMEPGILESQENLGTSAAEPEQRPGPQGVMPPRQPIQEYAQREREFQRRQGGGRFRNRDLGVVVGLPDDVALVKVDELGGFSGLTMAVEMLPMDQVRSGIARMATEEAREERRALAAGAFGLQPAEALPGTGEVILLANGKNAKAFAVFSRQSFCRPVLHRVLRFYHRKYQISIILAANLQEVANAHPGFFGSAIACGPYAVWRPGPQGQLPLRFFNRAERGELPGLPARWIQAFDAIVEDVALQEIASPQQPQQPQHIASPFLGSDHGLCRNLPFAFVDSRFPGRTIVPGHTFALNLSGFGRACFLTLSDPGEQETGPHAYAVVADRQVLTSILPAPGMPLTRAVGFDDFNADGYPEIVLVIENLASRGVRYRDNRVLWSRAIPRGPLDWFERAGASELIMTLKNFRQIRRALQGLP